MPDETNAMPVGENEETAPVVPAVEGEEIPEEVKKDDKTATPAEGVEKPEEEKNW